MKKILFILAFSIIANLSAMEGGSASKKSRTDQERPLTASELIALGDSHKKHGDWQKAVESYEAALPISTNLKELYAVNIELAYIYGPENPKASKDGHRKASFFFENCLTLLGHFKAEDASQQAELDKKRDALLYKAADSCFNAHRNAEAITHAKKALGLSNLSKDTIVIASLCRIIGACCRPTDIAASETYLRQGLNLISSGKTESKIAALQASIKGLLYKELAHTLFVGSSNSQGCNLAKLGEAKTLYNEALKLEESTKERANIWIQLGLICKKNKENILSKAYFEAASEKSIEDLNPQAYACAKMLLTQMK